MAGISPTQRTLKYYRDLGFQVDMVERWIRNPAHPAGGFRKDFMGFADIIGFGENSIIAIQSCGQSFAAHRRTIEDDKDVTSLVVGWLQHGGRFVLIGWRKVKLKRGGKAMRWKPRIKEYTLGDFGYESGVQRSGIPRRFISRENR